MISLPLGRLEGTPMICVLVDVLGESPQNGVMSPWPVHAEPGD
jgi:hypothetical protein